MFYFTRPTWNIRTDIRATGTLPRPVSRVYIHHSAGLAPGITGPDEIAWMRGTQGYHITAKGWADIAYNHVIMPSGRVYEGRGWTRIGAHTEGHNGSSIGVCFAGNFMATAPTPAAMESARELLSLGVSAGHLTHDYTIAGHRDTKATSCPGDKLYEHIQSLKGHTAPMNQESNMPPFIAPSPKPEYPVMAPVVGIAAAHHANGDIKGYIVVCADGGVFTFGEGAPYLGRVVYTGKV